MFGECLRDEKQEYERTAPAIWILSNTATCMRKEVLLIQHPAHPAEEVESRVGLVASLGRH